MLKKLGEIEWQQFKNNWRHNKTGKKIGTILFMLLIIVFVLFISITAFFAGKFLPGDFLKNIASFGYLGMMITAFFWGTPRVFNNLFSSRDVELLFTFPIPAKKIFIFKYFQNLLSSLGILALAFFPLLSLGIATGANLLFYPVLLITTISIAILVTAVCYIFNLGLIQVLPSSRAKELMTVMNVLTGLFIALLGQIPNLMGKGAMDAEHLFRLQLPVWLPNSMAASAISDSSAGSLSALVPTAILTGCAVLLFLLSASLVERGFRLGWVRLSEGEGSRKSKRNSRVSMGLKHPVTAIGIKEWRSLQRDMREWTAMFPLIIIFGIFLLQLFTGHRELLLSESLISWALVQALLLFAFSITAGAFTASSIVREGKAIWLMRAMPVPGWHIALGKFLVHWLIVVMIGFLFNAGTGILLEWSWIWILSGGLLLGFLSMGLCGLGLWLGTMGSRYNPEKPQEKLKTGTSFALFFLTLIYTVLVAIPAFLVIIPGEFHPVLMDLSSQTTGFASIMFAFIAFLLKLRVLEYAGIAGLLIIVLGTTAFTLYLCGKRFDKGVQLQIVTGNN